MHGRRDVRDEHAEDAVPRVGAGPVHVVDHEHGGFRHLVECAHGRARARVHVARVEAQGQQRCVAGVVDVPGEPAQGGDDPVVQLPGVDVEVVEGEPGRRAAPRPGPLGERGGLAEPAGAVTTVTRWRATAVSSSAVRRGRSMAVSAGCGGVTRNHGDGTQPVAHALTIPQTIGTGTVAQ